MDALAEDILKIADNPNIDPNRARVQIDTRKWLMSKIAAKRFGDRVQTEVSGGLTLEQLVLESMRLAEATKRSA